MDLLKNPLALLGLAYVGYGMSMLKQLMDARRNGADMSCKSYIMDHWPETVSAVLGVFVLWIVALEANQLTALAALTLGYTVNSGVDLVFKGGRSASLMGSLPPPPKDDL